MLGMGKGYKQADKQDAWEDCAGVRDTDEDTGGVVVFCAFTDRTARMLEAKMVEKRILAVLKIVVESVKCTNKQREREKTRVLLVEWLKG
jgi:hypothetical protein